MNQPDKKIRTLQFDEFLRGIGISQHDHYSLLLGAGSSISSDIPSAVDCIWEWKKDIYKSNNSNVLGWIDQYKNPKVQEVIQNWLDNQGVYPELNSKDEYSFYAHKCYPIDEHRRQYFQRICSCKKPSIGYKTIPLLAQHGILDSVWTTNLDDLVVTACTGGAIQPIEITLDSVQRLNQRSQNRKELPVIKLHGDFKYGELKNTEKELLNQDETFREKLIDYLQDKNLIVVGYSGRDASLMAALKEAYSKPGGGMLYWCGYGDVANEDAIDLISFANENGRSAFYVPTDGFDTTLRKITQVVVSENESLQKELLSIQKSDSSDDSTSSFDLKPERINKLLKSNAYGIKFPEEVFVFDVSLKDRPWDVVDERTLSRLDISAVPYNKQIWAFGLLDTVKEVFGDVIAGDIKRKPLVNVRIYNTALSRLLQTTLCKAFAQKYGVKTDYKKRIWSEKNPKSIANKQVYNAIKFGFDRIKGEFYLTLNPDFYVNITEAEKPIVQSIGLQFFHKIRNKEFNRYIDNWRRGLLANGELEFPVNSGSGFKFKINNAPVFTNICDLNNKYANNHETPARLLKLKGVQFKEAPLQFSTINGNKTVNDIHPMRGLLNNKPYETGINTFLGDTVELGIVSPMKDSQLLHQFLQNQNSRIKKFKDNDDYIIDYEGFYATYGISLNFPSPDDKEWDEIDEPNAPSATKTAHQIKQRICDSIAKINSVTGRKIIVVYIPQRWDAFTSYRTEDESFDLHDYIKAFCAEKGIMSQLIREKTIKDASQKCQINWWLSLSFFVKSMRTPWILAQTDKTTAFAGLGYSIDSKDNSNGHIVLGCSHIYSSTGEGLKYKLSRISNDKIQWRHKKPHLCYDDAYEFGKGIVNLFYESMNELPKRVVIHKRTFFTDDEKQGILDSIGDSDKIESVDLIEINFEDNIKYASSKIYQGKPTIDGFSVSRGTCIQLSRTEALLWAHGVVPSVRNPNYNFYPGGRYIPKPLRIKKHHGSGSLEQIANEILGLSKMNWNSLNMYSQLPATISSSNDIARIGKLIDSNTKHEYDYRYFI